MSDDERRGQFADAFIAQARSDWQVYRLLSQTADMPVCHGLMAPAIDRAAAPENAEYPWEANDRVTAPCNYSFPALSLLQQSGGRAFLKFVQRALRDFEALSIH